MHARLLVTHGKANVREVPLGRETLIGRSSDCNLKIASSQVSRKHCRILVTETDVRVQDLGSANGTQVNGQTIPANKTVIVKPGASLVIGPLKFVVDFAAPAAMEATPKTEKPGVSERKAEKTGLEETVDLPSGTPGAAVRKVPPAPPQVPEHARATEQEAASFFAESDVVPAAVPAVAAAPVKLMDTQMDATLADSTRSGGEVATPNEPPEGTVVLFEAADGSDTKGFAGDESVSNTAVGEAQATPSDDSDVESDEESSAAATAESDVEASGASGGKKRLWGLFGLFDRKKRDSAGTEPVERVVDSAEADAAEADVAEPVAAAPEEPFAHADEPPSEGTIVLNPAEPEMTAATENNPQQRKFDDALDAFLKNL